VTGALVRFPLARPAPTEGRLRAPTAFRSKRNAPFHCSSAEAVPDGGLRGGLRFIQAPLFQELGDLSTDRQGHAGHIRLSELGRVVEDGHSQGVVPNVDTIQDQCVEVDVQQQSAAVPCRQR